MKSTLALALTLASALRAAAAEPADAARGEKAFATLGCAQCHMIGSTGTEWGPNLTLVGFRKTPEWLDVWLKDPYAWNPKSEMPKFNLSDETRADLVAYLSAQKGQAWTVYPWRAPEAAKLSGVERGRLIFNKAGCVGCHGKGGVGGRTNNNATGGLIPELTKAAEGFSKTELHWMIQKGSTPSAVDKTKPKPMIVMPKWESQLQPDEIDAVGEYLFSLGKTAPAGKDDF